MGQRQWLISIILATQEPEIRRIGDPGQPRQKIGESQSVRCACDLIYCESLVGGLRSEARLRKKHKTPPAKKKNLNIKGLGYSKYEALVSTSSTAKTITVTITIIINAYNF
jgi:hypothetical protein